MSYLTAGITLNIIQKNYTNSVIQEGILTLL